MGENTYSRYDIEGLMKDIGLELREIAVLYHEYFTEMRSNIFDAKMLISGEQWEKFGRVVHNMKGISVSLNVADVYEALVSLDREIKNNIHIRAAQRLESIEELFHEAEEYIKEYIKHNSPEAIHINEGKENA